MTLILSKVTQDGVVMAADTAITESYCDYVRILTGARKLIPHYPSSSCMATWGGAVLPHPQRENPIAVEFALRQFADIARSITEGEVICDKLAQWLNETFPKPKQIVGIDVATVRPRRNVLYPAIYRIMNGDNEDDNPGRFRRFTLRHPEPYDPDADAPFIVAGDRNARFWVDEIRAAVRNASLRTGYTFPQTLTEVAAWTPSLVRSVAETYRALSIGQSIGTSTSRAILVSGTGKLTHEDVVS